MKFDFDLMDSLLNGIENAESKEEMMNDPEILDADKTLTAALEKLRGAVPENVIDEIGDAAMSYATAVEQFAILYGMHVMMTISACAGHPSTFSQHIIDRVNRERTA